MPNSNAMSAMERAQSRMLFDHLFFATITLNTPFIETKRFPTAATNMKVVYYNPDFINSLSREVAMFVVAHEIFHIILKHGLRCGHRDPELWNKACDYVIDLKLREMGFTLWQHCLVDNRFKDMYEEQVYAILEKEQNKKDEDDEPVDGDGGPGNGKNGDLGGDLVYSEVPTDPAERAQIERHIEAAVARATTVARQAGKMPVGMDLIVDGIINPAQDWLSLFVQYMTKLVQEEESWSRRNRRIHNFVLPSRRNFGMGPVGVIGDTSGSMLGYEIFAQIGEEIQRMCEVAKPEFVQVIWADYGEASFEERFDPIDQVVLHPKGGGGTDMRMPLKRMEEYEVDVCVLITDCETPWPDEPTPFPLIVLSTTDQDCPDWAYKIRIR